MDKQDLLEIIEFLRQRSVSCMAICYVLNDLYGEQYEWSVIANLNVVITNKTNGLTIWSGPAI